ncbi:MAG: asparaginase [Planctomycetaceae bacterium]
MPSAAPLVRVVRSGFEESVHLGHVAVCDASGRLLASAGDPDRPVFVRSCTKPVQGAVSLAAIGADERLPEDLVAIACASHQGEPVHVRAVRRLLRRAGLGEEALRTPPARPGDPASALRVRAPASVYHNCSGKHAAMLLASARAGWALESYRSRGHPLQRRVLAAVRTLSGVRDVAVGVDGCGVPVHGLPLRAVATMYARLSDPARQGDLAPFLERVLAGMRAHPYLVGGRDRDDTAIMQAVAGIVAKEGAEALDCAVAPQAGIGVAVKVADGGYRAAGPALVRVLDLLGMVDPAASRALRAVAAPPVLGGGEPVGRLEAVVDLARG